VADKCLKQEKNGNKASGKETKCKATVCPYLLPQQLVLVVMMKPTSGVIQLWKKSVAQFELTPLDTGLGTESKSCPDKQ